MWRACSLFLRNSGVVPTISPPRNTASSVIATKPYSPLPAPPGATSPSIMFISSTPPARLAKLS